MPKVLLKNKLNDAIGKLKAAELAVFGPVRHEKLSWYGAIQQGSELALDLILPDRTLKELFFPSTEPLVGYEIKKQQNITREMPPPDQNRVIFGARPCDAAGLAIDDDLFGWDYKDEYWISRRENTTIVAIACEKADDFCMCTSLKLAPDSKQGSDVLLRPLKDGSGWQIEKKTDKGEQLLSLLNDVLAESVSPPASVADVPVKFDLDKVAAWLKDSSHFENPFWSQISRRCLGCGVCTFLCPTCHCFDIQDEGDTYTGVRRKNWDSCSFAMFTLHTSGHNPRSTQASRWRQRIMHKFNYYPGKFKFNGCSGCGRCTRQCPVDMGVTETLQAISQLEKK